jgi:hypothetical protein
VPPAVENPVGELLRLQANVHREGAPEVLTAEGATDSDEQIPRLVVGEAPLADRDADVGCGEDRVDEPDERLDAIPDGLK